MKPDHHKDQADRTLKGCITRAARIADSQYILELRNSPNIVSLSSSQRRIEKREHEEWYRSSLKSNKHMICIIESDGSHRVGYARLEIVNRGAAEITIVVGENYQGKGYGRAAISQVVKQGFNMWKDLDRIFAFIRRENIRSIYCFERCKFAQTDSRKLNGHVCLCLRRENIDETV